ncbi:MAG: hypothetical protein QHH75_10770 [Bacillota bacterium]|nr:hypothetical protein [Bacillota bacterium]
MENEKFQELVLKQLQVLTEGQSRLESRLDNVDSRLGQVEVRLDNVDSRLGQVESHLENVDSRLGQVESHLENVDSRLGRVEVRLDNVETRLENVDSRLENVEKGQLKIETRLENEVIEKIRALFDDREVQNAKLDQIIAREENILADINYLVSRVVRLEKMAK